MALFRIKSQVRTRPKDFRAWALLSCVVLWIAVSVPCVECDLAATVTLLARQLMNQELSAQEKIRSEGDSGLKLVRLRKKGTKSYHSDTFSGQSVAGMHDHSNNERTVGMGEVIAVLNGVEFRTRHNDFRLSMPSTAVSEWKAVEDIEYPAVPPEVLEMSTPEEQIIEMQEWFKAWQNQDASFRDYKLYFKPALCYLEGTWTTSTDILEESFFSDRHHLDAKNWFDLLSKIRFTSYTGKKDNLENFAYLPTTLMNLIDGTEPEYAQWNFRILCHPLKDDLPLNRLHLIDDLANRMRYSTSLAEHLYSRGARFQLAPTNDAFQHSEYKRGLLDDLMGQIPGKDNYGGYIEDTSLGQDAVQYDDKEKMLNVAYYHRVLQYKKKGAMGESIVHRGFSDQNLFVAYTTQLKVSEMRVETCKSGAEQCDEAKARLSYAIPLEIIYMTPLYKWNPYNIVHRGAYSTETEAAVTAPGLDGKRNGAMTLDKAFDGTHSKRFYRTPTLFFTGSMRGSDTADTTKGAVGVLNENKELKSVTGSGTRIILPGIPGIGRVRTRYSIAPIYDDGSSIKKELDALKDIVLDLQQNRYMLRDPPASFQYSAPANSDSDTMLVTGPSRDNPYGPHAHTVRITVNDMENLHQGESIRKQTSLDNYHSHDIKIKIQSGGYRIEECDGGSQCWHIHTRWLRTQ